MGTPIRCLGTDKTGWQLDVSLGRKRLKNSHCQRFEYAHHGGENAFLPCTEIILFRMQKWFWLMIFKIFKKKSALLMPAPGRIMESYKS